MDASARQIDHRPGDWNEKKISAFDAKPPPRPSLLRMFHASQLFFQKYDMRERYGTYSK